MTGNAVATTDEPTRTERDATGASAGTNVGRSERVLSALLGFVLLRRGLGRRSIGGAATALAGGALVARGIRGRSRLYRRLDVDTATDRDRGPPATADDGPTVERTITVGESADDLAGYWRDPDEVNRVVGDVADVSAAGDDRHRWRVRGPLDRTVEWETRLVEASDDRLQWEAFDAPIPHEATVRFQPAPGDRGTEVTLEIRLDPPGGSLGDAATARLDVVLDAIVGRLLGRFKSLAETGEIPTTERNPSARGSGDYV